jgi:hypothetical protein
MYVSEVLAAAISEATSIPITAVKEIVALAIAQIPPDRRGRLDDVIDSDGALRLLSMCRQDQQGIRKWLRGGYLDAVDDGLPPFPGVKFQTDQARHGGPS